MGRVQDQVKLPSTSTRNRWDHGSQRGEGGSKKGRVEARRREKGRDGGDGEWVRGHSPGRGDNPEAGEAAQDSGAQERIRRRRQPDRPPPVRLRHLRGINSPPSLGLICSPLNTKSLLCPLF